MGNEQLQEWRGERAVVHGIQVTPEAMPVKQRTTEVMKAMRVIAARVERLVWRGEARATAATGESEEEEEVEEAEDVERAAGRRRRGSAI
jgi:hypothetical protein